MRARSSARRSDCTRRDAASSSRNDRRKSCREHVARTKPPKSGFVVWGPTTYADAESFKTPHKWPVPHGIDHMIKVGVVGGTGYTGVELLRILASHPQVQVKAITSRAETGVKVAEHFPSLRGRYDLAFSDPASAPLKNCDC